MLTSSSKIVLNTGGKVVVGSFNSKVFQMVEKMLNGDKKWSPLFIYSEPGLGKTCLLELIFKSLNTNLVFYTSGLEFASLVFEKLRLPIVEIEAWKRDFEKYEVFLFDDVHFLTGKTKTNEIFFQILNLALERNKIIIFTAENHPQNFVGFEKRLKSRFQMGLVLKINFPDIKDGKELVQQKINLYCKTTEITGKAVSILAQAFSRDIRRLEGIVKRLAFQQEFEDKHNQPINAETLKKVFDNKTWITQQNQISVTQIQMVVAKYFDINRKDLLSESRKRQITKIRHIALFLAKKYIKIRVQNLADAFNLKNAASVTFAIKKITSLMPSDSQLNDDLKKLTVICSKFNKNLKP